MIEQKTGYENQGWHFKDKGPTLGEEKNAGTMLIELVKRARNSEDNNEKIHYQKLLGNLLRAGSLTKAQILEIGATYSLTPKQILDKHGSLTIEKVVNALIPTEKKQTAAVETFDIEPKFVEVDEVILPTPPSSKPFKPGPEDYREIFKKIPRYKILIKLLEYYRITVERYYIVKGKLPADMVREEQYMMVVIPELKKMVLVCDQVSNGTFVVHYPTEHPEEFYRLSKEILRLLPMVTEIVWSNEERWKNQILDNLTLPDSEEKLEDAMPAVLAELAENKDKKKITFDILQTDREILASVVEQTKNWHESDRKTKLKTPAGYETPAIRSFLRRLSLQLEITVKMVKEYLNLLLTDPEKAKKYPEEAIKQYHDNLARTKIIDEFLAAQTPEDIKNKTYAELFEIFCKENEQEQDESLAEHFKSRLGYFRFKKRLTTKEHLPKEILDIINNYCGGISDDDLVKVTSTELFNKFLVTIEPADEEQKRKMLVSFRKALMRERKKRNLVSEHLDITTPEIILAKEFVDKLSDDDLKRATIATEQYPIFLKANNLTSEQFKILSFINQINGARVARGIKSEMARKTREISLARGYIEKLPDEQLANPNYESSYQDFLTNSGLEAKDYPLNNFVLLWRRVRDGRQVKPNKFIDKRITAAVDSFFAQLGELTSFSDELYQRFLSTNGLTTEDYPYTAFKTKLYRYNKQISERTNV